MTVSHKHFIRQFFLLSYKLVVTHGDLFFIQNTTGCFIFKVASRLTKALYPLSCCVIVWFMHKCTDFPLLITMKLANAQRDYVQISDTEFHSNQTVSEENMEADLFP